MIDALLLPFQFGFMQKAFLVAAILAVPTALLSSFLVLKGWSLMGDALAHAVLPGIVLAYLIGIPLLVGAFIAGIICSIATGYLSDNSRVKQDTILGVVFSGMFGLGLVIYASITTSMHLDHILFGNMLGIGTQDLWVTGSISLIVTLGIAFFWRDLMLHAFDPAQARTIGLPTKVLHYGLLSALSLTIVATLSSVGIILAIGLLIAPGAIAFLVTRRLASMMLVAVGVTLIASFAGIYASFWIDSAPAPTIILMLTAAFLVVFVAKTLKPNRRAPAIISDSASQPAE
ncbi:MAG: metal ABC transporter permease [Rhizobiales bacterium]|nr:metal ABC transporter permease [Hyphomicrobiales bacterium]MBO6697594.1 metal ABC transporter permease [Hyphomicrobiales bacterium]MBO6736151.1 metal ABC transporter permease [Hyphomicrobiales bacterium]MBO6912621.1 metal ABC transporter permease [Hyphomicrobiales bacterium]